MRKSIVVMTACAAAMTVCSAAHAEGSVQLTFSRTGSTASDVTTTVTGMDGVTARVESVSHSMKTSGTNITEAILCPDVNGNTSPTITFVISVTGLPSSFNYSSVGLDIHALNAGGAYQASDDNKSRQFNVDIATGESTSSTTSFATLSDIDVAAGVSEHHQEWTATGTAKAATSPLYLQITVTAGSSNLGCFFGLSSVTLTDDGTTAEPVEPVDPVEPPTVDTTEGKIYNIVWKNNTTDYMTEASDGGIVIDSYSVNSKCFWQLIPTENEDCYYVRNTASGKYIGSCNLTPSSASKIKMTTTPVEYYVHLSASTSGANQGCYWFSSTDCSNYSAETSGARCLNKDGASTSIITWTTALTNYGSYWSLVETEDLYEPQPFSPAAAIGSASHLYRILNASGKSLNAQQQWVDAKESADQRWYFVGTSNADGGYIIVCDKTAETINNGTKYTVKISANGDDLYNFVDASGNTLTLAGETDFRFAATRSAFALNNQIYNMPCGSTGDSYVTRVFIGDDYHYPLATKHNGKVYYGGASKPTDKYVIQSLDAAVITDSGSDIKINLNTTPADGYAATLYFDWDRDGVFEASQELTIAQTMTATIVPSEDAVVGKSRMRLRLTNNGLTGAEDDVVGEVLDLMLNYVGADSEQTFAPILKVNDATRGTATYNAADQVAVATTKGSATFVCWTDGYNVVSVDQNFGVAPAAQQRTFTAVFSPNMEEADLSEVKDMMNHADSSIEFNVDGQSVSARSTSAVEAIYVFSTSGEVMARAAGSSVSVANLAHGVYVAKAVSTTGSASIKIIL
jgi:hypothetical protein